MGVVVVGRFGAGCLDSGFGLCRIRRVVLF